MNWNIVSWVLRGRLRKEILKSLNKPKTATLLSKEIGTHRSTISQVLIDMESKKIIVCLDPNQPYNRYYKRTSKGDSIIKEMDSLND